LSKVLSCACFARRSLRRPSCSKGQPQLRPVIGKGLFLARDLLLFVIGSAIDTAEHILDALEKEKRPLK